MKAALFSVSYAGYWGQHRLSLAEFLPRAAALGYRSVELGAKRPHLSVLEYDDESIGELRRTAEKAGVEVATVAGYTDFTVGRSSAEVPLVEMQLDYVRQLARFAKLLGAGIVRVFSGYSTGEENHHEDWQKCVSALREAGDIAAQQGVVIGLQNHHDVGISVAGFAELLADIDHRSVKAIFDPWSVAITGGDLYESARAMAPHMVQTTLADYVQIPRYRYQPAVVNYARQQPDALRAVPLGEGFLDLAGFFAGLKEGGFDGYVVYEMCSPLRGGGSETNLDTAARSSLAIIEKLVG